MKRALVLAQLASILAMWVLASQTWASAVIIDTDQAVQISGLEAYPQISIALVVWLLIAFVVRYTRSLFSRFMLTAVLFLSVAILAPILFESASGSLTILSPSLAKATGVSDWTTQSNLISDGIYNHLAADLFLVFLIVGFLASAVRNWQPAKGRTGSVLTTRIDDLPSW